MMSKSSMSFLSKCLNGLLHENVNNDYVHLTSLKLHGRFILFKENKRPVPFFVCLVYMKIE